MADDIIMLPISAECLCFIRSLALGAALGLLFALACALRRAFRHTALQTALEDIFCWVFASAATFGFLMSYCFGRLRWYVFAGEVIGFLLFRLTLGGPLIAAAAAILSLVYRMVKIAVSLILFPFKLIFGFVAEKIMVFTEKLHKKAKKVLQNRKFCLKKQVKSLYNSYMSHHNAIRKKRERK